MLNVRETSFNRTDIVCLNGGVRDRSLALPPGISWPCQRAVLRHDWRHDEAVLENLRGHRAVVLQNFALSDIETLFRLRALQLLDGESRLDTPCLAFVHEPENNEWPAPGLRRRIAGSWPLRSLLFVAEGAAADWLNAEGIPVVRPSEIHEHGIDAFLQDSRAIHSCATREQAIGVHIQPMWSRCGSSTAFANEIDCLVDRSLFTIRIYIDHERRAGDTTKRYFAKILPQNLLDAGPCLETIACAQADWNSGAQQPPPRLADLLSWFRRTGLARNEYHNFAETVRRRTLCKIQDDVIAALAARAKVAIVNHAINIGFAARVCADAKLVLDTHDYLTRGAVERARSGGHRRAFPNYATLRRHAELESRLWKMADICTAVSESEERRIRRHAAQCLLVLPKPYVKAWRDPGEDAEWDILVVADHHHFNIRSVSWFLEKVVSPSPRLRKMRVAIVGKVREGLESEWTKRLANVKWLGYVRDLDSLRARSKIAVCPDQAGTGISVKVLTALAAGQPIVATPVALRGLPADILCIHATNSAEEMARDIVDLVDNPSDRVIRREGVKNVLAQLQRTNSYQVAIEHAQMRSPITIAARQGLLFEQRVVRPLSRDAGNGYDRPGVDTRSPQMPEPHP